MQLGVAIAVCELVGVLGSIFVAPSMSGWYQYLVKPSFFPPNWVFGPVWIFLYALIGSALYLAWKKKGDLRWFAVQLGLNFLWSVVFFGLKAPGWALMEILLLWIAITMTIKHLEHKSRLAASLLGPYLCWVSFAAALNLTIWQLN